MPPRLFLAFFCLGVPSLSLAQLAPIEPAPAPLPTPFPTPVPTPIPHSRIERQIAPGLTLLRVQTQNERGPLRYFLVRAKRERFRLQLLLPSETDALKKRSVRAFAAQTGAPVVINGGFFAYGGAAVGAVKLGGRWQRLPWKSRTALGWNDAGQARIGPLAGRARLIFKNRGGEFEGFDAALNGFTLPGERAPISEGFAVLTPMFAPSYAVKTGEVAVLVRDGKLGAPVSSGVVELAKDGILIVARGSAAARLGDFERASWSFAGPKEWDLWPHILGAGPRLVENGTPKTTEVEEEFRPDVVARGPRSAVGFSRDGDWLFLVVDGRQASSMGLSLPETARLFADLGAWQAMNLDGGSSTQLAIEGALANTPSAFDPVDPTKAREVMVSNALAFVAR